MTPGYLWCSDHESPRPPWRDITEWVEPQGSVSLKRQGTFVDHARWPVLLSCGHADAVFTDLDWQPSHGHPPNPDEAERTRQVLARASSRLPDDLRREWEIRADAGWPEPETGRMCRFCIYNRRIVSYEPIGPLTWRGDKERPSRAALQRRARAAESKADHLRVELARAEEAAAQLRRELDESAP